MHLCKVYILNHFCLQFYPAVNEIILRVWYMLYNTVSVYFTNLRAVVGSKGVFSRKTYLEMILENFTSFRKYLDIQAQEGQRIFNKFNRKILHEMCCDQTVKSSGERTISKYLEQHRKNIKLNVRKSPLD